ncbi:MAG: hypothetical protein U0527_03470 [Candidatus Eisenbacteria bacterium]
MTRHSNSMMLWPRAIPAVLLGACLAFAGCATRSAEQAAREDAPVRREPTTRVASIASGTSIVTTLQTPIATDRNQVGDPILLRTVEPIMASDLVALPAGSSVHGQVTYINDAGRIRGAAALTLRFTEVVTPDGKRYPIVCEPFRLVGKSDGKQSAEVISGGAVGGAILGGILGERTARSRAPRPASSGPASRSAPRGIRSSCRWGTPACHAGPAADDPDGGGLNQTSPVASKGGDHVALRKS